MRMKSYFTFIAVALLLATGTAKSQTLELKKGDHISYIGNTLADRMQHHGWLETLIHSQFPDHELVFRNLGFAADELTVRLRSDDFGTPDEWLTKTKSDVIFAFFRGYGKTNQNAQALEKVRAGVLDKNPCWFERYRTGDGYNVYGGRSHLKVVDSVSNRDSRQREMDGLDVRTSNRDSRIWAAA